MTFFLDNNRGVLLPCENNELSGALVKARGQAPETSKTGTNIQNGGHIADETWTLHLQPPKTKKG